MKLTRREALVATAAFGVAASARAEGADEIGGVEDIVNYAWSTMAPEPRDEMELESAVEGALRFDDDVVIERFVEGKEISVGVLDGKPLGAVEIAPRRGFYDFQNKYTPGRSDYYFPARLSPERYRSVLRLATLAHDALGCEGATRVEERREAALGEEVDIGRERLPGGPVDRVRRGIGEPVDER